MNIKGNTHFKTVIRNPLLWLGIVAAILYSSWPLGFILNPNVAHHALASQLEASDQPYNWLFMGLDILSGVALIVAGIIQWTKAKSILIKLSIVGYAMFAALVMVAALVPFNCNSLTNSCYDVPHTPLYIIHGLASIISVVFLLGSILLILKMLFERQILHWLNLIVLFIIACWGLTGLGALFIYKYHRVDELTMQYIFITICSVSLILSMVLIEYLLISYVSNKEIEDRAQY